MNHASQPHAHHPRNASMGDGPRVADPVCGMPVDPAGATERCEHEGKASRVTISLGVAEFARSADSSLELYKAADDKLYEAKRSGRNQVRS